MYNGLPEAEPVFSSSLSVHPKDALPSVWVLSPPSRLTPAWILSLDIWFRLPVPGLVLPHPAEVWHPILDCGQNARPESAAQTLCTLTLTTGHWKSHLSQSPSVDHLPANCSPHVLWGCLQSHLHRAMRSHCRSTFLHSPRPPMASLSCCFLSST